MTAPQAAPWIGKKQGKLALDEAVFGESFHGRSFTRRPAPS